MRRGPYRGERSGKTVGQIRSAPIGAVFIWCNGNLVYPRNLARMADRQDLKFVPPSWLDTGGWRGQHLSGIVVDHALELNMVASIS
jgi:hypothetical protein